MPLASLPTIEQWADDALTVMDVVGVEQAVLLGDTEGGPMAAMLAASHPERVQALVLVNSFARWRRADDYPIGMPDATTEKMLASWEQNWGVTSEILDLTAPSVANDAAVPELVAPVLAPRDAARGLDDDVPLGDRCRHPLGPPDDPVPTLVLHRRGNRHHRVAFGSYLADHIPGATYIELPGADSFPFHAGDPTQLLDEVEVFLTGTKASPVLDRRLATMLFTDVVGSTRIVAERGDSAWVSLLRSHDEIVRAHLRTYRGDEVDHTGDGFLAIFDGPARAVTCAVRMTEALHELGVTVRVGVHTGEIELASDAVRGLAVHIASRVMSAAESGGILASATVKDLVLGSGIEFADRGPHQLKDVPGEWQLRGRFRPVVPRAQLPSGHPPRCSTIG